MNLRWFLIIFAIGFVVALSNSRGNFMPKTRDGRTVAIVLIVFLIALAVVVAWVLLPFA